MKEATILKDGTVVRTEKILVKAFSSTGHLSSFEVIETGKLFRHFKGIKDKLEYKGYFEEESYLNYKAKESNNSEDLNLVPKFTDWEMATYGDEILISKRVIKYVGQDTISDNKFCVNEYKLIYNNSHFFNDGDIDISQFTLLNEYCTNEGGLSPLTLAAEGFFDTNIIKSELDDKEFINIIADISQFIHSIDENYYQAFSSSDFDDSLKQNQRTMWATLDLLTSPDYEKLKSYYKAYYNDLYNYHQLVSNYFKYINDSSDLVKAIALASSLHPIILKDVNFEKKLKMLNFIANEFFVVDDVIEKRSAYYEVNGKKGYLSENTIQNFLVNLTYSFDLEDLNPYLDGNSKVDLFLMELLKIKSDGIIFKETPTLFELIYKNLNQPFNITERLITITHLLFNTNYKPNTTRGAFVHGVYLLWQYSKFNPYTENGQIKPQVIGFNVLDSSSASLASFTNVDDPLNQNCLFYYTNEMGYESYTVTEELTIGEDQEFTLYRQKYTNAAPLVVPYESQKLFGVYKDNFKFSFESNKIKAIQTKATDIDYDTNWNSHYEINSDLIYGVYDIYQPVTIINTNIDTKAPLLTTTNQPDDINGNDNAINSLVPIFVLKYIDDAGDQSDAETMIGYLVDGVLTFSGIGNLSKLRHLRWAALGVTGGDVGLFTKQGLRYVLGGVEFTSGVIGFLANFVTCVEPSVPDTPENAQVWDNYWFCQNMKTFITSFQLATFSVTAIDSLASLALRKAAKRVTDSAGGGLDAVTLRQNVENRLQALDNSIDPTLRTQVADKIVTLSIIPIPPSLINNLIIKIKDAFKYRKTVSWSLHQDYTNTFLTEYIRLCKQELGLTDDIITDLVVIANRRELKDGIWDISKYINPAELELQTIFHVQEILKRGYCAGFTNLTNYKLFCNAMRNRFIQNLDEIMPGSELSSFINSLECGVQGSATRGLRFGDPNPINNVTRPLRNVDDIDAAFRLNNLDFDEFCDELIRIGIEKDFSKQLIDDLKIQKSKGKIMYTLLKKFEFGSSDFTTLIKNAANPHTSFDIKNINFAIIKKGGQFDNLPQLTFKY